VIGYPQLYMVVFYDLSGFIWDKSTEVGRFSRMRFFILGIEENHRKTGIDSKLYWSIKEKALELGINAGSASQLADINMDIINPIFRLGKIALTWRVYGLNI